MHESSFKVVIVGGSVAGLSLANMLQANNIDFIVLEAYGNIAPQIGASIGILSHGSRILDQLGLYEKVLTLSTPIDKFTFHKDNGSMIATHSGVRKAFLHRHGYPIVFLDRQMVLQVLYDNIKDKSKVLTNKRVKTIQSEDGGVTAITTDNSVYKGDIVIGADGIHSTVRSEMWKHAHKVRPRWFDQSEKEAAPCQYNCVFGISKECPGIEPGHVHSVFRQDSSYLVIGGPGGRVYWFRFQKLPRTLHGTEIPRYTEADAKNVIQGALDESITDKIKFATLIKNKISGSMTAVTEYVYKRWYFDRIICVGDSSHKVNPIGGQGGNAAIETAATLTNHLVKALRESSSRHLTASDIERLFESVQTIRRERVITVMDASHEQQRIEAFDTAFTKFQALHLLPLMPQDDVTFNFSCNVPAAEKLSMLGAAKCERLIPFKDELLTVPKRRGSSQWMLISFYLVCAAITHYGMWVQSTSWDLGSQVVPIIQTGTFPYDSEFQLKRTYTGIGPIDEYLVFLTAVFMPGLRGWDKSFQYLQIHFLGLLLQPLAIWTIEAFRLRNTLTLISFPIIWFTIFQSAGVGIYMPIYYAAYTYISDVEPYWWALKRRVPMQFSKMALPASLIGYAIPTLFMFFPWSNASTAQNFEVIWQVAPMLVPLFTTMSGFIYQRIHPTKPADTMQDYSRDVTYLKTTYAVTGILGAFLHWLVMAQLTTSSNENLSVGSVFAPNWAAGPQALGEGLRNLFLADFWGFWVATYIWCVSAVWDLKRVGRTAVDVTKASLLIFAAQFIVGPGAALSAVWYWREDAMARTIFSKEKYV